MAQPEDLDNLKARVTQMQTDNDAALADLGQQGIGFAITPSDAWAASVRLNALVEHLLGDNDDPRRQRYELANQQRFTQIIRDAQEQIEQAKAEAASQAARAKLLEGVNGVNLPTRP